MRERAIPVSDCMWICKLVLWEQDFKHKEVIEQSFWQEVKCWAGILSQFSLRFGTSWLVRPVRIVLGGTSKSMSFVIFRSLSGLVPSCSGVSTQLSGDGCPVHGCLSEKHCYNASVTSPTVWCSSTCWRWRVLWGHRQLSCAGMWERTETGSLSDRHHKLSGNEAFVTHVGSQTKVL